MTAPHSPVPDLSHAPWRQKCGAPLDPLAQLLVDGVSRGNIQWVRMAVLQGVNPTQALCRIGQSQYSSALGLAIGQEERVARWMLRVLLESRAVSSREMLQDFMVHASLHGSDAMIDWFMGQLPAPLSDANRGASLRVLAARKRWSAITRCSEHLWQWDNVHTGVNSYTASFVWARAILSDNDHADMIRRWSHEVLLRFEHVDPRSCKTALDELALCCGERESQKHHTRVIQDLVHLLHQGSTMAQVPRAMVNPLVFDLLEQALDRVSSSRTATALEQETAPASSEKSSGKSRL